MNVVYSSIAVFLIATAVIATFSTDDPQPIPAKCLTLDDLKTYVSLYNEAHSNERDFSKWSPQYYVKGTGCAAILSADRARQILRDEYGIETK